MSHTLSLEYPESLPDALHMTRAEFEQAARLAMAAKLFETGKLTSVRPPDWSAWRESRSWASWRGSGCPRSRSAGRARAGLAAARLPAVFTLDGSPVLLVAGLGGLNLLPSLYGSVVVPAEVVHELEAGAALDDTA